MRIEIGRPHIFLKRLVSVEVLHLKPEEEKVDKKIKLFIEEKYPIINVQMNLKNAYFKQQEEFSYIREYSKEIKNEIHQ